MPQEKHNPTPQNPFGLTCRDYTLLSLLIVLLIIGLLPARLLVQCKRGNANPLCPSPTALIEELTNTPTTVATDTLEIAIAKQETDVPQGTLTSRPTGTSPTSTMKPTITPTETPSVTPTITATTPTLPTASPTITPTTDTDTPTLTPAPTPSPVPAEIIYVQSNGQTHRLGMVTSAGQVLNDELHLHAAAPAWSPDGTKIAFFGEPSISTLGDIYELGTGVWIIDDQGKNPTQIIQIDHVENIAWSPDSMKLAFEFGFGPPDMPHEIMVVDPRDGEQIGRFRGEQPGWSPDSQRLVIKGCLRGCGLWLVNLDGSGGQQITSHSTDSYPAWSPNDQYLTFTSERDGNWEIYLLQLADGNLLRLTNRPGTDTTPVFGPDGQEVYLRTDAFGGWRITVTPLDGSNERLVKEGVGPSDEWGLARPAVR